MTRVCQILLMWALCSCLTVADVPPTVLAAQQQRIEVIRKVSRPTVAVFGPGATSGGGSAVIISPDGYALTNFHVTKPIGTHLKCGLNDGEYYDAVLVSVDPTGDVALIQLLGREDFPVAELGDSDSVRAGDWCIVSGNPFLLATDFHPTITYGIVSGVHRYQYPSGTLLEYADCIQTDAAINPGNSGGPLWSGEGKLIGINGRGSFEKRGRVNVGVGYAISINQVKNFLGYLHSGRIVDHATLGATVASDDEGRVVVTNILSGSDAYRRGLRYGDQVVAFGGREIGSVNAFKNALGIFPKGWRVPLSFLHDGERKDVLVRLAGVHRSEELMAKLRLGGRPPGPPRPGPEERPPSADPPKAKAKFPANVAERYLERTGYTNFFYNRQAQRRVWAAYQPHVATYPKQGVWRLQGTYRGQEFEIQLGDELAEGRIQGVFESIDFDRDLADQRAPRNSGGLLLALHQWRRFMTRGPEQFGDLSYLGTAPLRGSSDLFDVLVGTYDTLETRFYFDPTSGRMVGVEMFPDIDVDPCEVYFTDPGAPQRSLEIVFGETTTVAKIREVSSGELTTP